MHLARLLHVFMAATLVVTGGLAGCSGDKTPAPESPSTVSETPKMPAPEIVLADEALLEKLVSEAKGKVLVLNFWATWCPPCVKEMPDFAKFYRHFDKEKVAFISLSADDPAELDGKVAAFQKDKDLPFPIYILNAGNPDAFYGALRVELSGALPATVIYGKDGIPKQVWERETTFEELKGAVTPLL